MKSLTDMAGDLTISTAQVLTALRIVATRAGVSELSDWAAKEVEGYEEDDELPKHRIWDLSIVGNMLNPAGRFLTGAHLGHLAIPEEYRKEATTFYCRQSVGDIEKLLHDQSSKDGPFAVANSNLAALINMGPMSNEAWGCTHAFAQFGRGNLDAVVTKARQTALKLCLECEEKGIELKWGEGDDNQGEGKQWRDVLSKEATKAVIKGAWETARDLMGR